MKAIDCEIKICQLMQRAGKDCGTLSSADALAAAIISAHEAYQRQMIAHMLGVDACQEHFSVRVICPAAEIGLRRRNLLLASMV